MFCPKCGANNNDSAVFCANCGAALRNAVSTDANNQNGYYQPNYQQPNYQQPNAQLPMKWWKFLVSFGLFATAAVYVLLCIGYLCGIQYAGMRHTISEIYDAFGGLQALDIIYGIGVLGFAACWAIITRQNLYRFKKNGPKMLLIGYVIGWMINPLYEISLRIITGLSNYEEIMIRIIALAPATIISIILNRIYFNKRSSMFVN